jgi:DNA-binding PadR family transcriptional regulator
VNEKNWLKEFVLDLIGRGEILTAEEMIKEIGKAGKRATTGQLVNILLQAEREGFIEKVRDDRFDELKPLTSVGWKPTAAFRKPKTQADLKAQEKIIEVMPPVVQAADYVCEARLVVSQPSFAFSQLEQLKKRIHALEAREAIEKVIIDAKKTLRVISPFYDELFMDILSKHTSKLKTLDWIRIISDQEKDQVRVTLKKAQALFPNVEIRYLYKGAGELKIGGIHAKILIADTSEALIGSFNFTHSHVVYNIDAGLLVTGKIVQDITATYDTIWSLR